MSATVVAERAGDHVVVQHPPVHIPENAQRSSVSQYRWHTTSHATAPARLRVTRRTRSTMTRFVPAELADDTLDIISTPTPAELRISPDVVRVLDRAPRSCGDWVDRNIAALR
ncbi:hypothetical protein [Streptomyces sp. Ac-502]|uniref:hypothetical protein n=1 Tax=Streptomyces sp. Ac-502 TaxID=3342801 RepID=UPI0038626122